MSQQYPPEAQPPGPFGQVVPPQPPKKRHVGRNIGLGCGGLVLLVIVISVIAAVASGGSSDKPTAKTEPKVVPVTSPSASSEASAKTSSAPSTAQAPAAKSYPDGDYQVGTDIPAGTYESAGAADTAIPLCSITTKPTSDATLPQIKAANKPNQQIIITLTKADGVVTIAGCKPLHAR